MCQVWMGTVGLKQGHLFDWLNYLSGYTLWLYEDSIKAKLAPPLTPEREAKDKSLVLFFKECLYQCV